MQNLSDLIHKRILGSRAASRPDSEQHDRIKPVRRLSSLINPFRLRFKYRHPNHPGQRILQRIRTGGSNFPHRFFQRFIITALWQI